MSNPLIECLKLKLNVSLRYFSQVVHVGIEGVAFRVPLLLCISEHSLLFLDQTFTTLLGEIFYAHINRIIEQEDTSGDVIRFEFSDQRPSGIPRKMTLITGDKRKILDYLRCCWETDYMWRLSTVATLQIHKERINIKRYKDKAVNYISKDIYLAPPSDEIKIKVAGYGYFIKKFFKPTHISVEHSGINDGESYLVGVIIKEVKLLEQINPDIRTLAELFSENLIPAGTDYAYLRNNPYIKKYNLSNDIAKWEGWETLIITTQQVITVIILRRKFIPPLMDSGQDFYIYCTGGEESHRFCMNTADSIYTLGISSEVYRAVLAQRCEGLIMDEETAQFYQNTFQIKPSKIFFAYQVLISVLSIINRQASDPNIQKIIEEAKKRPESKNPDSIYDRIDEPYKIIQEFCKSSYLSPGGAGYKIWCKKVYRYLAYCINGGLLQGRINFSDILAYLMEIKFDDRDAEKIRIFIARMVDISHTNNEQEFDDIHSGVVKMLESSGFSGSTAANQSAVEKYSPHVSWRFNAIVMQSLIESGYMKKDFEQQQNALYPKLLLYLLQKQDSSQSLKLSICRACLSMNETTDTQTIRSLFPHILDIYLLSNYTLATQAAITLANLSYNNREHKQLLYKSCEGIMQRLNCKDSKLLSYTIMLLINLCSDPTRKKAIARDSRVIIRKIVVGNEVVKQSIEVITKCYQILGIFCKDHSNAEIFNNDEEMIRACVENIGIDFDCDMRMLGFLENLCERSVAAKGFVGRRCIGEYVKVLKKNTNLELIRKIIEFFQGIVNSKDEDNYHTFRNNGTAKVLDGLLQNMHLAMDNNLVRKITELKELLK